MRNNYKLINEILGQVYMDEELRKCLSETVKIHPERIRILHQIVMNRDYLSKEEIRERAYLYAKTIRGEELAARQIFLCLLHMAES